MANNESNLQRRVIREEIEDLLIKKGAEHWKYFSPSIFIHWRIMVEKFVPQYLHGSVLDDGCGQAPYLEAIKNYSEEFVLLDHNLSHPRLNVCADVRMLPFRDHSFDCVMSFQVLEHVSDPFSAIQEAGRTLNKGGLLLLSVPHLSRLHELPHDYFRFTENGLRELAHRANLEVIQIEPTGGLLSFLGHQISLAFLTSFWKVKILRSILFTINKVFITKLIVKLDKLFGYPSFFPQGYAMVAKKI